MVLSLGFLDMDGTTIHYPCGDYGSSWDKLADAIGKIEENKRLLKHYLHRRHLYDELFRKECSMYKGVSVAMVRRKVLPPVYTPGARRLAKELRDMSMTRGLLTAGVDVVARYVEEDLHLDFCECNELIRKNGCFTGDGRSNVPLWEKSKNMKDVCRRYGIEPDKDGVYREALVIGDHDNEMELFKIAGTSIAYRPKSEKVARAADYVVHDLNEVPAIVRKLI
jgi:phosphoserine phosphatase